MAPAGGRPGGGGSSGEEDKDAKHLLDRIGAEVQKKAEEDALQYNNALKGNLSDVIFSNNEKLDNRDVCQFDHNKHTNVTSGHGREHPCFGAPVRFSDTNGAECYSYGIKGNDSTIGFCAPYRRLHLCVKNLEEIDPVKINSTHNLLVDVLLAAKYEGESLVEKYKEFKKKKNHDFNTNICTILARSFADIGDIIRGKDLYLGDQERKHLLEKRLERMFENIKENNNEISSLSTEKVREYWWALNRDQVWKAITCRAGDNDTYSIYHRKGLTTFATDHCGHGDGNVPTNLDYVPQFLRWFDEWGEEFCRKRNIKLNMAKKECRDQKQRKYCSLNGFDCTKLIRNKDYCSRDIKCTACSNKCIAYDFWLGNERDEFKIQKGKYENEIKTYESNNNISNSNTKKEYYKEFYDKFGKKDYKKVQGFLRLLNKGMYCQDKNAKEEEVIDFTKDEEMTFHRSEYCQPCPDCVVDYEKGEFVMKKKDDKCENPQKYTPPRDLTPTNINVLFSGDNQEDITEKLRSFCTNGERENDKNYQTWKCYHNNSDYNICEMKGSSYKEKHDPNIIISDKCFHLWVKNLLIDIIKWETKLKNCINHTNVTDCDNKCKNNCECFDNWISRKKKEWEEVKKVYKGQEKILGIYYKNLNNLFDSYFFEVMHSVTEEKDRKWNQITGKLKQIIESSEKPSGTSDSQDKIKLLLDHLKDNATTCKDNNSLEPCDPLKDPPPNPCGKNNNGVKLVRVKRLAEMMQQYSRNQLEKRGGESNLKADASKGQYKQGGPERDFKELCNINEKHSNRNPAHSSGPCDGKGTGTGTGTRFDIETVWEKDNNYTRERHEEFIIPPRRRHICTSNLEYLQTPDVPFSGDNAKLINDSFLGDVLLSAKYEAQKIIDTYKEKNNLNTPNDQATACRAIRYSFADIGDIIRGRDIWDKEPGMLKLREHLETVFGKIKKKVPGKYDNDKDHKQLREDWWEANRHQVWRAMKCVTKDINNNKCKGIPIEDYIPQRLRWITEWAEWYCKFKSDASEKCKGCWDNDKPGDKECKEGTTGCKEYKDKIEKWKKQWIDLQTQYSNLYAKAKVNAFMSDTDNYKINIEDKDKPVYDFLFDLYLQNGGRVGASSSTKRKRTRRATTDTNTPYDNVGSYLYDTEDFPDCKNKTEFCESGRKIIRPSRPPDDPTSTSPSDDDTDATAAPEKKETEKDEVCGMVKALIGRNNGNVKIEDCNVKENGKQPYPEWECGEKNKNLVSGNGECMPPRRQKLCLYFLAGNKLRDQIKTQDGLRTAFIKCAAAETFLSWNYYKKKNGKGASKLDKELKQGQIPSEFLRSMFYTFGDYRDIFFDTDISKKVPGTYVSNARENIDAYFDKNPKPDPTEWWKQHGPEIWHGMLCALSYNTDTKEMDPKVQKALTGPTSIYTYPNVTFTSGTNNPPTLETFAQRPQFLRWFTEWGEEFCKLRELKVKELVDKCKEYECNKGDNGKKEACKKACQEYQQWLQKWKDQYEKQSKKYFQKKKEYKENLSVKDDVNASTHAYNYLQKALTKLCPNGTCSVCMDEESKSTSEQQNQASSDKTETYNSSMPASLDDEPKEVKGRCNCKSTQPEEEEKDEICGKDGKSGLNCDAIKVSDISTKNISKTNLIGLNAYNRIARINSNVYISPRVQQLYLQPLQDLKDNNTDRNKLIEILKKCAYIEGKGLYEYYNNNKSTIGKNDSELSDEDIKTYTLEAMKRSYADYGNIVKGDMWWIYPDEKDVDTVIISVADKFNANHKSSVSIDEDTKRLNLWKSIRTDVWKAMLCGYKKGEGNTNSLRDGDEFCKLPSTDEEDQFLRWFEEWGQNFCIRHEKELKQLKDECEKGTCDGTDEVKKKNCKKACENYRKFLFHFRKQYENQKKEYEILKSSFTQYQQKDALTFLKEKCNSKCLCFKEQGDNYSDQVLKNVPDDFTYECDCKKQKASDHEVNDLDKCPNEHKNNNICNKYKTPRMCAYSNNRYSLEYWYGTDMLIPPRRRKICLRNITGYPFYKKKDGKNKFKNALLSAAMSEATFLCSNYEDKREALQAIKYTFADIGDIIKGTDMMDDMAYKKIKGKLEKLLEKTGNDPETPEKWWEQNKKHVWNIMLCGYKEAGGKIEPNDCNTPSEENTDQFLRWLKEWGTQYCKEKEQLKSNMKTPCESHLDKYGIIENRNDVHRNCLPALQKYEVWSNNRLPQLKRLSSLFDELKGTMKDNVKDLTAYEYLKQNCSKCICSFKDIEQTHKKSTDGGYDIYVDTLDKAQIPGFLEDTAYRYKGINPECPNINECNQYGNIPCKGLPHDDDNDWSPSFVKDNKKTNMGVLLPPRRKHLCLRIEPKYFDHLRNEIKNFKNFICSSARTEVKRLKQVYKDDNKLLEAMKYSFSDIGSVVKGDDMMDSPTSEYINKIFKGRKYSETNRKKWWNENKYHVWESMLCGYKQDGGDTSNNEKCRFPDIEPVPQFLRWFQEWTKIFCIRRNKLYQNMVSTCENAECDKKTGKVKVADCIEACEKYKYYVLSKKKEYDIQRDKYDKEFKMTLKSKNAPEFLNVECLSEYFNDSKNWENPYESINDSKLKGKCDCQKIVPPPLVPPPPPPPPLPPQADEPFDPTILQTTIPFGVALALGSIAFLFLKKKAQAPVDLFSVINIPKGDYDIPTLKSSNRYIPYASDQHKGKTYIYMEGDSSGDEKYAFMSDTTDVTSSESEYEELDINDIYVPGSPKYKTLIEVVLEPSKRDIQSDNTPMNKFTDDEWNQLKHDFISNMLQNQPNYVPNDYKSGNVTLNTQPNTLYFDKPEEKPFITSIHDRNLYNGEEYSYNVNMVNNDDIPINRDNNVYSGIDLINDSLNSNKVDIYDELLKRKENELFGTNHPKHTNTHNVTKSSNSDPIDNQLDLFHTWLDRHRDMCEQWNNKEEVLDKLKEEWNKDNNSGNIPSDSNKTLNTDVSIQIHMDNPKPINEFTNMDTILEDLEKYNEPYYDVQDDIYYDVHDHDTSTVDSNAMDVPSKVQIEMDINTKLVKEKYPIADVWDI
ncbi:erythrocyte membrane protein 1, PfEMP1, putative [Plasmodium sp.]|nr:erythrocyte membrane protein 1, PfEMP1, putative [Plasmodium sp.]